MVMSHDPQVSIRIHSERELGRVMREEYEEPIAKVQPPILEELQGFELNEQVRNDPMTHQMDLVARAVSEIVRGLREEKDLVVVVDTEKGGYLIPYLAGILFVAEEVKIDDDEAWTKRAEATEAEQFVTAQWVGIVTKLLVVSEQSGGDGFQR